MGWESFNVVRFDLQPLLQGQTRTAKLKSAYNSLQVWDYWSWANLLVWSEVWGWHSFGVVSKPTLKVLISPLLLVLEVWDGKPTWAWNLLVWSDLTLDPSFNVMGWESFGVVGFDLGPLLQGQMRRAKLKSAYNVLIIGPTGLGW